MTEKKVIIIGGGFAGLSVGAYLQMNGYQTQVFEMIHVPGGLCTGWERKGYIFDGCIHWLVGSNPASNMHTLWEELHLIQGKTFINHEIFRIYEGKNGETFTLYTNLDKLEQEMKRIAPEDGKLIEEMMRAAKSLSKFDAQLSKAPELSNFIDKMKTAIGVFPYIGPMVKWSQVSISDLANKFKSPFLAEIIPTIIPEKFTAVAFLMTLGWWHAHNGGYPIGGSLGLTHSLAERYTSLGGKINYNCRVERILVEEAKAVGIELANGEKHAADIVISAADGYYTIFKMLEGKYVGQKLKDIYQKFEPFPALMQVSLGVARTFTEEHHLDFPLTKPIKIDNEYELKRLGVTIYNFDPTLAPAGKTSLVSFFPASYEYWTNLRESNPEKYKAEKDRIAKEIITALDKRLKNVADKVEVIDVATPATYVRYTNNYKGSFEGWLLTPDNLSVTIDKTLPGLQDFYMVGQWIRPGGGLPTAAMTAREAAQVICARDRKRFVTIK